MTGRGPQRPLLPHPAVADKLARSPIRGSLLPKTIRRSLAAIVPAFVASALPTSPAEAKLRKLYSLSFS
jgi:hypothetical protein